MDRYKLARRLGFGSVAMLVRRWGLKGRNDTGLFYIGLGDHFDDDRRVVRVIGPSLH